MIWNWSLEALTTKFGSLKIYDGSVNLQTREQLTDAILEWLYDNGAIRTEIIEGNLCFWCKPFRLALGPNPLNSFESGSIRIRSQTNEINLSYELRISKFDLVFALAWTICSLLILLGWFVDPDASTNNLLVLILLPASGLFMLNWIFRHAAGRFKIGLNECCQKLVVFKQTQ